MLYGGRYSHTESGLGISSGLSTGMSGASAMAAPLQLQSESETCLATLPYMPEKMLQIALWEYLLL